MSIVGGFDLHRSQITFDYLDTETGEVSCGRIAPADRAHLRDWLNRFKGRGDVAFALEGCTGWRFVVEELRRVGINPHLAEPADTSTQRGPKKRAKTDRADARLQRELLTTGRLPESWIPPDHVLEARTKVRLYAALSEERKAWRQRLRATLFHQGVSVQVPAYDGSALAQVELSPASRQAIEVALCQISRLTDELVKLREELANFGRRQLGCRALQTQYGIGGLLSVVIWEELGDCRRFRSSSDAVRHSGLDVTVYSSDDKRSPGHLAKQGPAVLRWALYEAAMLAAKATSPDHPYFSQVRARCGTSRAAFSVGRKILRRSYHMLRGLGDEALAPAS
jgi:transposase